MKAAIALAATVLLTTSDAALAQSATDVGCLLVSNVFAKSAKDSNAQKLAEASLYFYLGRISDRTSATQLKTLFEQQAKTINDANAGTLMNACVKSFESKMNLVQSVSPQAPQQTQPSQQPLAEPQKKPEGR